MLFMKKSLPLLAISTITLGSSLSASILVQDSFGYTDGSLVGATGSVWGAHSASGSNAVQVSSGSVLIDNGSSSREDVNIGFSEVTSGSVFYSLEFSVSDNTAFTGSNVQYFAHLRTSSARGRLSVGARTGTGDFTLGISTSSPSPDAYWGSDLSYNTTYTAVVRYDLDADQSFLWVNPTSEASTMITGSDGSSSQNVSSFAFRQANSSNDEVISVSNLIVGTTFLDVAPVPEPSAYGLIGGLIVLGFAANRRQR